jgi:hypothetical protein
MRGRAAPLGAEGRWTEDRFRFPGVDPALRVTVDAFCVPSAEVEEELSVEDPRFTVEALLIF